MAISLDAIDPSIAICHIKRMEVSNEYHLFELPSSVKTELIIRRDLLMQDRNRRIATYLERRSSGNWTKYYVVCK